MSDILNNNGFWTTIGILVGSFATVIADRIINLFRKQEDKRKLKVLCKKLIKSANDKNYSRMFNYIKQIGNRFFDLGLNFWSNFDEKHIDEKVGICNDNCSVTIMEMFTMGQPAPKYVANIYNLVEYLEPEMKKI